MHIEPGVVDGAKMILGYATGATAAAFGLKLAADSVRATSLPSVAVRSATATALVFAFFELLPHAPVGVSEVHLILGSLLMLVLGTGPTAIGLALGLLLQGTFFAPSDLPQLGMNVTTLLVPLFAISILAERIIPAGTAYVDLTYKQVLALSASYQGGIVAWVAFWAFYGHGVTTETMAAVGSFGAAYMLVVLGEPLVNLAVLAAAKRMRGLEGSALVTPRLHRAA